MKNYLTNFIRILILLILSYEINCQVKLFYEPEAREQHSAVILNRKLYISGGRYTNEQAPSKGLRKEFFYYDLSTSSNTLGNVGWQEIILLRCYYHITEPQQHQAILIIMNYSFLVV